MKDLLFALQRQRLRLLGVKCAADVRVRGIPMVYKHPSASIVLGQGVVLQSKPKRYHAYLHSPVKLLADRAGAEINIGSHSRLNGVCVHAVRSISIGARCLIAAGVQILDSHGHIASMHDPSGRINTTDDGSAVIIEDDVWIGLNAIVLPGTRIGYGSIVGAGVVVAGAIPPGSVVKSADFVVTNKSHCAY